MGAEPVGVTPGGGAPKKGGIDKIPGGKQLKKKIKLKVILILAAVLAIAGAVFIAVTAIFSAVNIIFAIAQVEENLAEEECIEEFDIDPDAVANFGNLSEAQRKTAAQLWEGLKGAGYSDEAAAALMANSWKESSFNADSNTKTPNFIHNIGGETLGCVGLFQWCHQADKIALSNMPGGWKSVKNQVKYMTKDMSKSENSNWYRKKYGGSLVDYYFESGSAPNGIWFETFEDFKTTTDMKLATTVFLAQWEIPCPNDSYYGNKTYGYPLPRPANACWIAETQDRLGKAAAIYEEFSGKRFTSSVSCVEGSTVSAEYAGILEFISKTINNPNILYGWGRQGPDRYDCSGWVSSAFKYIGVDDIPAGTAQMLTYLPTKYKVIDGKDRSKWRPGDILVWGGAEREQHTAIYIGDNKIAHFNNPGQMGNILDLTSGTYRAGQVPHVFRIIKEVRTSGKGSGGIKVPDGMWASPLGKPLTKTSSFGWRTHPIYGDSRLHSGVDIAGNSGDPIYAVAPGMVVASKYDSGCGNYVMIQHRGYQSKYCHMVSPSPTKAGQSVKAGAKIGSVGSTGSSTAPHLHFEIIIDGSATDPVPYLKSKGVSIT